MLSRHRCHFWAKAPTSHPCLHSLLAFPLQAADLEARRLRRHHQDTAVLVSMCSTTDSTAQGRNGRNALLPGPQGAARNYPHPWQCRGIGPLPTRASLMRLLHNNGGKSQFPQHGASICIPKWALRPRRASASTKQSALCSPTHRIWGS